MFKKLSLSLLICLLLFGCSNQEKKEAKELEEKAKLVPKPKKDLSFKLSDGKVFSFMVKSDEAIKMPEAKPLLMIFFTRSCLPCTAQIAVLNQVKKEFANLNIMGVLLEENVSMKALNSFLHKNNAKYPVANSADIPIFVKSLGGIGDIPAMYLYDKNGKLFASYSGLMALEMLRTALINIDNKN